VEPLVRPLKRLFFLCISVQIHARPGKHLLRSPRLFRGIGALLTIFGKLSLQCSRLRIGQGRKSSQLPQRVLPACFVVRTNDEKPGAGVILYQVLEEITRYDGAGAWGIRNLGSELREAEICA